MLKAVVFDLDGTLTKPFFDFKSIREEIGVPPDRQSLLEKIEAMAPGEAARAMAILKRWEDEAVAGAEPNPGAGELLACVRDLGLRSGVVTRNADRTTFATLKKLGLHFERVITRDSGLPIKPHPAAILALMAEWGVAPTETLVVGDFRYDLEAARAAGAGACLVTNGRVPAEDGDADYRVATLDEVRALIESLARPGGGEKSAEGMG